MSCTSSILMARSTSTGSFAYSVNTVAIIARCQECSAEFSRRDVSISSDWRITVLSLSISRMKESCCSSRFIEIVVTACATSAPPGSLNGGDVDLLHRHHRLEGTLRLTATSRKRIGQRPRGDLPRETPAVLAPTARAFRAAIADDRVLVTVCLFLIVCRDLERKGLGMFERRAAVESRTRK